MASYLDIVPKFREYVPYLDPQAVAQVGMYKQQKYEENVQKIQDQIDKVAGLPVSRPVDKNYLQSKLDELGGNLRTFAAGDFSNFQLVNSVSGMTKQIINDPYIKAAVQSSAAHQNNLEFMEEERKKGTLTPDNEAFYNDQFSKYYNSGLKDKNGSPIIFNGSYTKHYDIDEDIRKEMAAAHADSSDWEDVVYNKDGTINTDLLAEKSKKGMLSGKVKNIIDRVFNKAEVQQQLKISGWYNYRNYTPQMLADQQYSSYQYYVDKANEQKKKYELISTISKKDGSKSNAAILNIDNDLFEKKQEYDNFISLLNTDPESAKLSLYKSNLTDRYLSQYSWEENSLKTKVNPVFEAAMKRADYNLQLTKSNFDMFDRNRKYLLDLNADQRAEEELKIKKAIAEGKLNADGSPKIKYNLGPIDPKTAEALGASDYKAQTDALNHERLQTFAKIVTSLPGYEDLYVFKDGKYQLNFEKYKDWKTIEPIYRRAIVEVDKAHQNGTIKPNYASLVSDYYDMTSELVQRNNIQNSIDSKYKQKLSAIDDIVKDLPNNLPVDIGSKKLNIDKNDLADINLSGRIPIIGKASPGALEAKERIMKKYNLDNKGLTTLSAVLNLKNPTYRKIGEYFRKEDVGDLYGNRDKEYRNLMMQSQNYYGTENISKAEDKLTINQFYADILSNIMQGPDAGNYKTMAEWVDAKSPENLNRNIYTHYKGTDGKWYLQIKRNDGSGGWEYSEPLPVRPEVVAQLGVKEDPNIEAFRRKFGGFLNNFGWQKTTNNFMSDDAENTAIMRKSVGKYSVGYHLKAFGGGFTPVLYVRDSEGNVVAKGLDADFSVYAKDKSLPVSIREKYKNSQTIIPMEDVLPKLNAIDEHFIELMLQNK